MQLLTHLTQIKISFELPLYISILVCWFVEIIILKNITLTCWILRYSTTSIFGLAGHIFLLLVSEFVLNMYYYQLGDLFGKLKLSLERMQGQITRMSNGFCTEVWLIEECFQWLGEMNRSVRSCSFKFCGWKEVSNNAERCKLPLTKKIYFLFRNCFGTFTLSKKIKFQKCFG